MYLLKPLHRRKIKENYFLQRNRVDRFQGDCLLIPFNLFPLCKENGYTGYDYTYLYCSFCVDIDECTSGTHNCHSSLASCTNTAGSFSCTCNSPYRGDGKTCNLPSGNQLAEYQEDVHSLDRYSEKAKLALIFHAVIIITKNQECVYSLDPYLRSLDACYFNLDCLKRVSV